MTNSFLFQKIKELVSQEHRIGAEILECLYEIHRRRAYAELKYDGLFSYCVKELGFTESQAYQRIEAMRALKEMPELKPMIQSGSLSVTAISHAQKHFKKQTKAGVKTTTTQKLELFKTLENKSAKTIEKELSDLRGEKEIKKLVIELTPELEQLWERVKNLSAHKTKSDPNEILRMLTQTWLNKNDLQNLKHSQKKYSLEISSSEWPDLASDLTPTLRRTSSWSTQKQRIKSRIERQRQQQQKQLTNLEKTPEETASKATQLKSITYKNSAKSSRYISKKTRALIWNKAQAKCQNCESKYALQIEHIKPFAKGGTHHPKNLRLLCRSCNQHQAILQFGLPLEKSSKALPKNPL